MVDLDLFKIDFTGEFLHVVVRGKASDVTRANNRLDRILGACAQYDCKNILLELHTEGERTASDQYAAVNHLDEMGYTSEYRLAVVDQRKQRTFDELQFGRVLGEVKGWNGRLFKSVDDAKAWLTGPI